MPALTEIEKLEQGLTALEAQRAILGDEVVEAMLAPIREKMAALRTTPTPPPSTEQQRKLVTILFADVSGFTLMSEAMDAEDVSETMNALWQKLDTLITEHGGRIDKHIGDAVMALWGTQTAREDDPERAIHTALLMQASLREFAAAHPNKPPLQMRIGLNTGVALLGAVGTMGEYTAMGDPVNIAQRLETAAPIGSILISHDTYRHVRGVFNVDTQPPIRVKGKTDPVLTYLVKSAKPRAFRVTTRGVEGLETHMVGRDTELNHLQAALDATMQHSQTHVATIVGEAGVGKSRLLYEFGNWVELRPERFRLFRGRATPGMTPRPYALMRDVFMDRFGIFDSDSVKVVWEKLEDGLARFIGWDSGGVMRAHFIGQLLGFDFSASPHLQGMLGNNQQLLDRALAYLTEFFAVITAPLEKTLQAPVIGTVIFLEDIHWADEKSLDLIAYLARECPALKLMIVCLTRLTLFERRPTWGADLPAALRLNLRPLSKESSEQLVREILRKVEDLPAHLQELIVNSAEGNPFYVEELIKMLIEDHVILKEDDDQRPWRVASERLAEVRVPPTLTGVLQARLDSLPADERLTMQKASVVGRIFWDKAVSTLGEVEAPEASTGDALARLHQRELIFRRDDPAFIDTHEYIFKHAILRDVTYESVLKRARRGYHLQVAHWLIAVTALNGREPEYYGLIGEHFEHAGEVALAVSYLNRAGAQALQISAFREAQSFFERALALVTSPEGAAWPEAQRWHLRLTRQLGEAYWRLGDFTTAQRHFEDSVAVAQVTSDLQGLAEAHARLGRLAYDQGALAEAQRHVEASLSAAKSVDDRATIAYVLNTSGYIANGRGDHLAAREMYLESLAIRKELGDPSEIAAALNSLGNVSVQLNTLAEAKGYYQESLTLYQNSGNRYGMSIPLYNLGDVALQEKDLPQAKEYFAASLELTKAIGNRFGLVYNFGALASVAYETGNYHEAKTHLREAITLALDIGAIRLFLSDLHTLAQVWIKDHQPTDAAELIGFIQNHPSFENGMQADLAESLAELQAKLAPEVLTAALDRGQARPLEWVKERVG